ncbi:hypothetical protein FACS1894132_11770 [Clostridia bacterium]|nr:hypothetical protein FACS1894132_11770 [Clostridia bacterium]
MENKYERIKRVTSNQFKRLIGVKQATFENMKAELEVAYTAKQTRRGRHSKLSVAEMLLMALEYWRQYITFAELALNYGVAESTAHDIVVWVENVLIKSGEFALSGKKILLDDNELEVILVDVTESPVERPKKNSEDGIQAKRNDTQ